MSMSLNKSKHINKHNTESLDVFQPRNGGNTYTKMTQCDNIFCEDIPAYPQGLVNQMLARNSSLLQYAQQDVVSKL